MASVFNNLIHSTLLFQYKRINILLYIQLFVRMQPEQVNGDLVTKILKLRKQSKYIDVARRYSLREQQQIYQYAPYNLVFQHRTLYIQKWTAGAIFIIRHKDPSREGYCLYSAYFITRFVR